MNGKKDNIKIKQNQLIGSFNSNQPRLGICLLDSENVLGFPIFDGENKSKYKEVKVSDSTSKILSIFCTSRSILPAFH